MSFTWDWLVVVIAKWRVIEPRLIKALSGFEKPDWAVKVIITVENEGFGELERDSGFARAGWTDLEKDGKEGEYPGLQAGGKGGVE